LNKSSSAFMDGSGNSSISVYVAPCDARLRYV